MSPRSSTGSRSARPREGHARNPQHRAGPDGMLAAGPESVEAIQSRVVSADALVIVSDDEAAQYIGGYIK